MSFLTLARSCLIAGSETRLGCTSENPWFERDTANHDTGNRLQVSQTEWRAMLPKRVWVRWRHLALTALSLPGT